MASHVETMVFSVSSFPLADLLDECRGFFSKPQLRHFQTIFAGLMLNGKGKKNIMDIASSALDGRSRSSLNRFLHGRKRSPEAVDRHRLEQHARGRKGGVLIIDDTLIEKTGREMEGTGYLYDHTQNRNVWRHCYVTTMFSDGDERVPLHLEPYVKEEACASSGRKFRTKNELAVELVDQCSQELMGHLDARGMKFIAEAESNRLIGDGEDKMQAKDYLAFHQGEFERIKKPRTEYRFAHEVVSEVKGGITVKFVLLKKEASDDGALVLMTNALAMSADEVMLLYKRRWDIEVYCRDCKQSLGMSEYQVRSIDVGVIHLLLVNLVYTRLKSIACGRLFHHIFKGARSIGAMCEALKRFAAMRLNRSWRDRG